MPKKININLKDYVKKGMLVFNEGFSNAMIDEVVKPVIDYNFSGGKYQNSDGSFPAHAIRCTYHENFQGRQDVIQFKYYKDASKEIASAIRIQPTGRMRTAGAFAVEMTIYPLTIIKDRIRLISSYVVPFNLNIIKEDDKFYLMAVVKIGRVWRSIKAKESDLPLNEWSKIALVFNGDDVFLFLNDKCVARRVFYNAQLISYGTKSFYIGNSGDARLKHHPFIGYLADFKFWDCVPYQYSDAIDDMVNKGFAEIDSKHLDCGGDDGFLGKKISEEFVRLAAPSSIFDRSNQSNKGILPNSIIKGRVGKFEHGNIYWSKKTGAHVVYGDILDVYSQYAGHDYFRDPTYLLGFPITSRINARKRGVKVTKFEKGAIYWSEATGAVAILGEIYVKYVKLDAEKGLLGLPISEEIKMTHQDYLHQGKKVIFEGGTIYWSFETGAFEVHGNIRQKYESLLSAGEKIGYPTSDVLSVINQNGNVTRGKLSNFEYGNIYYTPSRGAFFVHGEINDYYVKNGGPLGKFGYPITDQIHISREWRIDYLNFQITQECYYNEFQNGIIVWQPKKPVIGVTNLELYLGRVVTSEIDDAGTDRSADLIIHTFVKVNNRVLDNWTRRPSSGYAGDSYDINETYSIGQINHNTQIELKVNYKDYDYGPFNDDNLGSFENIFSIWNYWGLANSENGVYNEQGLTDVGEEAKNENTVRISFALRSPSFFDANRTFRDQCWWHFDNFTNGPLSREFFANTFKDVEITNGGLFSKITNPFDTFFYEHFYKELGKNGNCFGMCLEALNALKGNSLFTIPLDKYQAHHNADHIRNDTDLPAYISTAIKRKHGYQLDADVIYRKVEAQFGASAFEPLRVFSRVKNQIDRGESVIIGMRSTITNSGHAVLAYKYEVSADTRKLYVADPNVPFTHLQQDNPSYIEFFSNNTFRYDSGKKIAYQSEGYKYKILPKVVIYDIPYHLVSSMPTTISQDIYLGLLAYFGGLLVLAGDADVDQISDSSGKCFYQHSKGKKEAIINGIPGLAHIIPFDAANSSAKLYAQKGQFSDALKFDIRGKKTGTYKLHMRNKDNGFIVEAAINRNEKDKVAFESLDTSRPLLSFRTNRAKSVKISYGIINDVKGRGNSVYDVTIPLINIGETLLSFADQGDSFMIAPAGNSTRMTVDIAILEKKVVNKYRVLLDPQTEKSVFKINLSNFDKVNKNIMIESYSAIDGNFIDRKLLPLRKI